MGTHGAWVDLAVIQTVFALGNLLLGRFEQHLPRWKRLVKWAAGSLLYVGIAQTAGRAWAGAFLGVFGLVAAGVHLWWLPKHGINGWTAEPYDRYLTLVGGRRRRGSAGRATTDP